MQLRIASSKIVRTVLAAVFACAAAGCGDDDPVTAPTNQAPLIAASANASFGMAQLTTFAFTAVVQDPEGNPVTIRWTFSDGTTAAGANVWRIFPDAGTIEATATATDNRGASGSSTVSVTVGSASGDWEGSIDLSSCEAGNKPMRASLTQTGSAVTGSLVFPEGLCTSSSSISASVVPGEGTRIFGGGGVRLRAVLPSWADASFTGQIGTTGNQITGSLEGVEPTGITFTLDRQ